MLCILIRMSVWFRTEYASDWVIWFSVCIFITTHFLWELSERIYHMTKQRWLNSVTWLIHFIQFWWCSLLNISLTTCQSETSSEKTHAWPDLYDFIQSAHRGIFICSSDRIWICLSWSVHSFRNSATRFSIWSALFLLWTVISFSRTISFQTLTVNSDVDSACDVLTAIL